jgi:ABC-type uncharacterized transport system involved in gliding motility auxiliary subunit
MPEKPADPKETEQAAEDKAGDTPPEPDKPDLSKISGKGVFREQSPDSARIFVVASSEMLKDQLMDEGGISTNSMFVLNMIDALNGREETATMRSKVQSFNPLKKTGPGTRAVIKAVNIVGLPALMVVLGLIVWARRHARRKRIQSMFEE